MQSLRSISIRGASGAPSTLPQGGEGNAPPDTIRTCGCTFEGQRSGYGANLGMAVSTNRKNRVLQAPPPQPSILAKRRSWEPTFHFAANWVLRVQDLNLAKGSNNRFRQAIKMLPCVLCRAPAIVGFAM